MLDEVRIDTFVAAEPKRPRAIQNQSKLSRKASIVRPVSDRLFHDVNVSQAKGNPASIAVTPDADLSTKVQISGVTGIWSKRDGGSHVEYGDEQIIAVMEPPMQIEHRLQLAGLQEPTHDDETGLPELRRVTVLSRVRAAYEWFRYPAASYDQAAESVDHAIRDTQKGKIAWKKKSDTDFEGTWSIQWGTNSGLNHMYRLRVDRRGRITYRYISQAYGPGTAKSRDTVNVGNSRIGEPAQDCAIQDKLAVLLVTAQRAIVNSQKQIS